MARQLTAAFAALTMCVTNCLLRNAAGQQLTTEAAVMAGATTENVSTASSQVRVFGDISGWHFYGDGSWAARRGPESDAFGAAYPYGSNPRLLELKVEKTIIRENRLLGLRLGRYRTPFGIYNGSDQGYMGFLRAPLIRNSYYWALSNNYLDTGGSVVAGTTWLSGEASAAVATDEDEYSRPGGLNGVVRVQAAGGPFIVGASYIHTRPSRARPFAKGTAEFAGMDARWMKGGVQVRGEWIDGRPFQGVKTRGGYADVLVHRPVMGPITAVARIERLDYNAGVFSEFPRRYTVGARLRLPYELAFQMNYVHQPNDVTADPGHASLDVSLSYTVRPRSLFGR